MLSRLPFGLLLALVVGAVLVAPSRASAALPDLSTGVDSDGLGLVPALKLDLSTVQAGGGVIPCAASCCVPGLGSVLNGEAGFGLLVTATAVGGVLLFAALGPYNPVAATVALAVIGIAVLAGLIDAYTNGVLARALFPEDGAGGGLPRRLVREGRASAPPPVRPLERASADGLAFPLAL